MYVIAGVSGHTGKVVAEQLLSQGKKVRVIVRDPSKGEPWKKAGAEVAVAHIENEVELAKALEGAEGAYLLLPPDYTTTDNVKNNAVRTGAMGRALAKAGVPHVVFLSSIGAQHERGTGPIKTLHRAEIDLPKLAPRTRFTWLRPAYFLENVGTVISAATSQGVLPAMFDPKKAIPMIATADVGRAAANALIEGPWDGRLSILELAGPREVSLDDLAKDLSTLLGKAVATVSVPASGVKSALEQAGLNADLAGLYQEMSAGFETGLVDYERNGARFERGQVEPIEVLRSLLQ
jgi:uncharacterized protein YbjT (DUF2867 family)